MSITEPLEKDLDTQLIERQLGLRQLLFAMAGLLGSLAFVWVSTFFLPTELLTDDGLQALRQRLLLYGYLTPVIFCLLYGLRSVFYLPEPLLIALAGFLVGPLWAVPLVVAGSMVASTLVYLISRSIKTLARNFAWAMRLARYGEKRLGGNTTRMKHLGFRTLLVMRMLPIFPFTPMTYGAVLVMNLSYRRYLLALGLGVIPPAIFYSSLASLFLNPDGTPRSSNYWQMVAVTAVVVFWVMLLGYLLHLARRRLQKRTKNRAAPSQTS